MRVSIDLRNGAYIVYNGDDVDNIPYTGLLVIHNKQIFFSGYTANPFYDNLAAYELVAGDDIFTKLGVTNYHKA